MTPQPSNSLDDLLAEFGYRESDFQPERCWHQDGRGQCKNEGRPVTNEELLRVEWYCDKHRRVDAYY